MAPGAKALPARPSLEHLRKEAKQHLVALRHRNPQQKLAAAQLAIARAYGFSSWRRLKVHLENLKDRSADDSAVDLPSSRWVSGMEPANAHGHHVVIRRQRHDFARSLPPVQVRHHPVPAA